MCSNCSSRKGTDEAALSALQFYIETLKDTDALCFFFMHVVPSLCTLHNSSYDAHSSHITSPVCHYTTTAAASTVRNISTTSISKYYMSSGVPWGVLWEGGWGTSSDITSPVCHYTTSTAASTVCNPPPVSVSITSRGVGSIYWWGGGCYVMPSVCHYSAVHSHRTTSICKGP